MVEIRPLSGDAEAHAAASIMATSEPWLTLGRTLDRCVATFGDESLERYVAVEDGHVVGFIVVAMRDTFSGYIKSVGVREDWRSRKLGTRLIAFAEERIFRESPNVFICVSSFNPRARTLYERLGYETVGGLRDFIVRGHDEILLRKTIGPLAEFSPR